MNKKPMKTMGEKRDTHCPGNNSEIMKKRRLQLKTKPRPIVSLGESYISKVEGKEFIQMEKSIKMKRICMIQEVKITHMADS